uniref:Uncharacterized protein n=1 Tax=Candidatus Kentrum sp. UNK TaxID=2126344 RepID=A0A451AKR4_9GAMM|nr:MAG: hypothetical protein BECKUNK1418G_GA0071005_110016 [Candidatus Kentron sp. UNK]VFK72112.1 MAG: hypothetical protein BECKUNK1418H_GA0071006_109616 [Candidatus Kentron sp. UNK]
MIITTCEAEREMNKFSVSEKQKFRKNRRLRKEHPVWILLLRANMFPYSFLRLPKKSLHRRWFGKNHKILVRDIRAEFFAGSLFQVLDKKALIAFLEHFYEGRMSSGSSWVHLLRQQPSFSWLVFWLTKAALQCTRFVTTIYGSFAERLGK